MTLVLPQVCVLTELPDPALWFSAPGMYGASASGPRRSGGTARLAVGSHCRVVGCSGRTHHVTPDGRLPGESGWWQRPAPRTREIGAFAPGGRAGFEPRATDMRPGDRGSD
nr:hypothetical protein KPHV_00290 [Kitasatospora purpeofusca]BEK71224.1 hypothetical protein KPHV_84510 [Kitasatospora purpeofusca]